jgi:hypothetical protein
MAYISKGFETGIISHFAKRETEEALHLLFFYLIPSLVRIALRKEARAMR